jgi:hypothetical protein
MVRRLPMVKAKEGRLQAQEARPLPPCLSTQAHALVVCLDGGHCLERLVAER